jgi:hypothetical protein
MKLISENVGGNTHAAVAWANKGNLAKFVLQIHTTESGMNSIVVLRVPDDFDIDLWYEKHYDPKRGSKS